jgi:propionyl-CoA synthetase
MLSMAGHRLSTSEMEEIVSPSICCRCAVIGINDALKGQPLALVVTKLNDEIEHFQLEHEIIK